MFDSTCQRSVRITGWTVAVLAFAATPASAGPEFEAIFSADPDGSAIEQTIASDVAEGRSVLATGQQHLYWIGGTVSGPDNFAFLRRSGLDGSNVENLYNPNYFAGIAVDSVNAKLYLSVQDDCIPCGAIVQTDLDGTNAEFLFPTGFPGAIAVHPASSLVCWYDSEFGDQGDTEPGIACGVVGGAAELIVEESGIRGLAIDAANDKLYWTRADRVRRSNLDGSIAEDLVLGLDEARDLALDPTGDRMWWVEQETGIIRRAALDGSGVQEIVQGLDAPTGLAFLDAPGGAAYDRINWLSVPEPAEVPASSTTRGGILLLAVILSASIVLMRRVAG